MDSQNIRDLLDKVDATEALKEDTKSSSESEDSDESDQGKSEDLLLKHSGSGSNDSDSENSSNNEDWEDEKQEENQSTVDYKPFDSILAEDFEIERRSSMGMSDLDNHEVEDKSSVSVIEGRKDRTAVLSSIEGTKCLEQRVDVSIEGRSKERDNNTLEVVR